MSEKDTISFTLHRVLTPAEGVAVEKNDSVVPIDAQRIINMAIRSVLGVALRQVGACDDVDSCKRADNEIRLLYESCRAQLNAMYFLAKGEAIKIFGSMVSGVNTKMPCVDDERVGEDGSCKVFLVDSANGAIDSACDFLAETIRNSVLKAVDWESLPKRFKSGELETRADALRESLVVFGNSVRIVLVEFANDVGQLFVEVPEGLVSRLDDMICVTFAAGCDGFDRFKKYFVGVLQREGVLPGNCVLEFCDGWGRMVSEIIEFIFDSYFSDEGVACDARVDFLETYIRDLIWLGKIYENGFSGCESLVAKNVGGQVFRRTSGEAGGDGDDDGDDAPVVQLFPNTDKKS